MRQLIFLCLFLVNSVAAHASEDRKLLLAQAGYKDAVKVTKISDGGEPREALVVLTHNGELRMVEGLYDAVTNNRQNETTIATGISELAVVSDRLLAIDRSAGVSFVEPINYSLNHFSRDLFEQGHGAKVFFPWGLALATVVASCNPEQGVAAYAIGVCAQVTVAGRMYINRQKLSNPREAVLSPVSKLTALGSKVSAYQLQRDSGNKVNDLLLHLDGDKIRLTELREIQSVCDSVLVPLVKYQYEFYNP